MPCQSCETAQILDLFFGWIDSFFHGFVQDLEDVWNLRKFEASLRYMEEDELRRLFISVCTGGYSLIMFPNIVWFKMAQCTCTTSQSIAWSVMLECNNQICHIYIYTWRKRNPMVECIIDTMNQTEFHISVVSSDSPFGGEIQGWKNRRTSLYKIQMT